MPLPASITGEIPGEVFAVFDQQDSGNISYGVDDGGERYFVKTAGRADDSAPYLSFDGRADLLRNAAELARSSSHPALPVFERLVESADGPLLVYRWADGELVGGHRGERDDPASAFQRFRALPVSAIEAVVETVLDLHVALTTAGWVALDLYDGCLIYDFATAQLTVIDLDTYHRGPLTNQMGRMFGSDRFMAPEEFELGATIDERTTVFTLARLALVLLSHGADGYGEEASFRGRPERLDVIRRATAVEPEARYRSVAELADAWR